MKKVLIATGVAVLAFATLAGAQGYTFSNNLTVGSTGADVVALQTWLIQNGYSIPAISSGAAAKGYFGAQTKTAVMAYQAAHGIPNTGFVGPLTRAALNAGGGAAVTTTPSTGTVVTCPAGYTCTPVAGATTPVTGAPTGITTPGVPGTLAVSLWNSPSNGTVVYKGQAYDVVTYKVQASASDMAVQSISLDFDSRLWLYADSITLHDDTGAVIGSVSNLSQSNFTELTVGSDYRITIPVSNYVVRAAQTKYITANVHFLTTSDRVTGYVGVTQVQIRSVDGTGVTDTETVGNTGAVGNSACIAASSTCRNFNYQGSGAGSVVVTVDSSSPLAGLVQISTGGQTQNVPLAVYDVKSQNAPSTLRSLSVVVYTTGAGSLMTPSTLFSQYTIKVGGQTYGAQTVTANTASYSSLAGSSTVTFTNLNVPLAADTYVPITLLANVAQDTNNALDGAMASTSWAITGTAGGTSNNPDVEDSSYNTLAINSATFISSNLTFSGSSATLSNLTATLGSAITGTSNGGTSAVTVGYNVSFGFTLTAGNNTLFMSADPNQALATTSTGLSAASSSLSASGVVTNPGQISGDTANSAATNGNYGYYTIPAGSSRQFTFNGAMSNVNGVQGFHTFQITAVKYGTTTTALTGGTINYNLQPLKVSATF
ncbi:MAG: peptidoglycan-binding protein [Patescibacteria group bacterium]|nr:peptidoglycan-binding protein [Patescibacteria group bacterium]MDE2172699.1 peptidoglycan-binding protein [Patescibacteria group bacterium]